LLYNSCGDELVEILLLEDKIGTLAKLIIECTLMLKFLKMVKSLNEE
jgi:hypothetical protein